LEKANLGELGQFLQSLTASGAPLFPDRELENHLRSLAGLPPAPEDGADMPEDQGLPDGADAE
jgi:hypothetical protein